MSLLLRLYYLLSIVPLIYHIRRILNSDIHLVPKESFAINFQNDYFFISISIIGIISWIVLSSNPMKRYMRAFYCLVFYCVCFLEYSFGKVDHYTHIWLYLNFLFIFIKDDGKNIKEIFSASKYLALSFYAIAGSWKIFSLVKYIKLNLISNYIYEVILHSVAAGILPRSGIANLFFENELILTFGFLMIIIFQLLNYTILFTEKYLNYLGYLAIAFHIITGMTLGMYFLPTILCLLVIFPIQNLLEDINEFKIYS